MSGDSQRSAVNAIETQQSAPPVVIADYDPRWPRMFEEEKEQILSLIAAWAASIEHIGSTSVPGLGAKPIIDIMIGIRSLHEAPHCITRLETIGYEYVPRHEAVMPERRYFHKGPSRHARTHHVHMVETTSEFWERHLLFRDYLRAHADASRSYYELKKRLAEHFGSDRDSYTDAKTSFIESIVARAGRTRRAIKKMTNNGTHSNQQSDTTEELRILLWDIDGTLMRSSRRDAYKDYTIPVLENIFGTAGRLHEMTVSGMTDLQIIVEALRDEGFTPEQVRGRVADLRARYMEEMERATRDGSQGFHLLPGVREVLEATGSNPRYRNALLTGNIEPAAHLKMKLVGLSHFFDLPGAFGDDSHDRRDLPQLAIERISRHLNLDLRPEQFIVIGDTPNDIACARHGQMRAVAVATGRMYPAQELLRHEPDALLPDLSDLELVLRTFDSL